MTGGTEAAQKLAAAQRKVKQLERKVATLGVLQGALKDENDDLKAKLAEAESREVGAVSAGRGAGGSDEVEEITAEFAERLASIEGKLLDATEQRDELRAELRETKREGEEATSRVRERDETIAALQSEGDGLARKVGELEGAAKRLRSKLREETAERERLQEQVKSLKEDFRSGGSEGGTAGLGDAGGSRLESLSRELEQERQKYEAMADKLRKSHDAKFEEFKASVDAERRQEVDALREREYKLSDQVQRLRSSLMELESTSGEREDSIRRENRLLEHRYRQLEAKLEEAASAHAEQSRPLLLEIESLRAAALKAEDTAAEATADFRSRLDERDREVRVLEGKLLASETIAMSTEEVVSKLKETVADTNRQLEQQHERVLEAVRRAAEAENEARAAAERERELTRQMDRREEEHRRVVGDKDAEVRRAEKRCEGILREAKGEAETSAQQAAPSPARQEDSGSGLEDLLKDSEAKLNWDLLRQGGSRDRDGEVMSLTERLRSTELARDEALEECVKLQVAVGDLTRRCDTAMVLVGEGEERVEQLEDDIREMKKIFHDQISTMADQLQQATRQ